MTRARLSYGLLTSQNQGGGDSKQGLVSRVGKSGVIFRVISRKSTPTEQKEEVGQEKHLLTITSGGQDGQPPLGTVIFQGYFIVDTTQVPNIIVGIYENFIPTNLQLPMDDVVYHTADNVFPLTNDGVNFTSETLFTALAYPDANLTSSFNLFEDEPGVFLLYSRYLDAPTLNTNYYTITIS